MILTEMGAAEEHTPRPGQRAPELSGATLRVLRDGNGFVTNGRGRCRARFPEADQNVVHRVLQAGVGLVQLAGRLGGKLAELVAVRNVGECSKDKI